MAWSPTPACFRRLNSGGFLSSTEAAAPGNAVVEVLREQIPAGFDQYTGYDLVLYVNLTSIPLAAPELGIGEGSQSATVEQPLEIGGF